MNPEVLLRLMSRGKVLGETTFRTLDPDVALAARDEPPFDGEWMRVFDSLKGRSMESAHGPVIERIRERAFKLCFAATGDPDLSGYVSDDFDLLARALSAEVDDEWLARVMSEYLVGRFPSGDLPRSYSSLRGMVQEQDAGD
jgi:hypothetical protein